MTKLFTLKNLYYLFTAIIALLVGLAGGIADIIPTQNVIDTAAHLGYSLEFFFLLGIFKILGAIALFFPNDRIKDIAYAGFTFDFIFASYSHYVVADPAAKIITPLVFLAILAISFILKEKIKNNS